MRGSGLLEVVEHRGDAAAVSQGGGDMENSRRDLAPGQIFPGPASVMGNHKVSLPGPVAAMRQGTESDGDDPALGAPSALLGPPVLALSVWSSVYVPTPMQVSSPPSGSVE